MVTIWVLSVRQINEKRQVIHSLNRCVGNIDRIPASKMIGKRTMPKRASENHDFSFNLDYAGCVDSHDVFGQTNERNRASDASLGIT